ncbi:zinc finger, CCHC-type containing protein [Tanacetum coccineum]
MYAHLYYASCPPLIAYELDQIKNANLSDENFSVSVSKSVNEVVATYTKEETRMDLVVHLPLSYSLTPVDGTSFSMTERERLEVRGLLPLNIMIEQQQIDRFIAFHAINARRLPLALLVYTLMTTSSANNSVFRGFFKKQKLTGHNFIDWYRQLRIVLSIGDKLNYLEQPLPPAPVAHAGQQVAPEILATHTAWVKGSKEIVGLMLMIMDSEIQRNLENLHAYDMLQELKTKFDQQVE